MGGSGIAAHFVFRVKKNLRYLVKETRIPQCPDAVVTVLEKITDELITYKNDADQQTYRLVSFSIANQTFQILTDRRDLTTFQIIMLYGYRWQIELMFRFLKRTLNGLHLIRNDKMAVTIQFYALMIIALLLLLFKQKLINNEKSSSRIHHHEIISDPFMVNDLSDSKHEVYFLERITKDLKKYWKISLRWLVALRSLLSEPFDQRVSETLNPL